MTEKQIEKMREYQKEMCEQTNSSWEDSETIYQDEPSTSESLAMLAMGVLIMLGIMASFLFR